MTAIKSITVYKIDYMQPGMLGEMAERKGILSSRTMYDESGKVLEETSYLTNGTVEHKSVFKYNSDGNMIEEHIYGEDNEFEEKRSYLYNSDGNIVCEYFYYLDETFDTINYVYDDKGKLLEKNTVDSDNDPEGKEIYEYIDDLPIKHTHYDVDGIVLNETSYKHDETKQLIEITKNNIIEETFSRTEIDYNEKGSRVETRVFNADDQLISRDIFEEDDKGLVVGIIEEDQYSKNTVEMEYDDNGNLIEQIETNANGEINYKIQRTFDSGNNLSEHSILIDKHGQGVNQNITLIYQYEFF